MPGDRNVWAAGGTALGAVISAAEYCLPYRRPDLAHKQFTDYWTNTAAA